MSFDAAMVIEVRSLGSGSGGYKTGASGTDRSQQNAAYITFTDLQVKNAVYTRVYSVIEDVNLVADLIGNTIRVTGGTNFLADKVYEITGQGNDGDNYLDLDRNCASGNSNDGAGVLGGALPHPSYIKDDLEPGNIVYYKADGTYSLNAALIFSDAGTSTNRIHHRGYDATRDDDPHGNDRPLFSGTSYFQLTSSYINVSFMRFNSDFTSYTFRSAGTANRFFWCDFVNTGITSYGFQGGTGNYLESCHAACTDGSAFFASTDSTFIFCHADLGSAAGFWGGTNQHYLSCIAEECTGTGFLLSGVKGSSVIHCTVNNCGVGIDMVADRFGIALNNQITDCTTGITGNTNPAYVNGNNYFGNGADVGGVIAKGPDATADDPGYAGASDFSEVDVANALVMQLAVGA